MTLLTIMLLYRQKAVFEDSEGSMFRGDLHYIKITHVIPTLRDTIFSIILYIKQLNFKQVVLHLYSNLPTCICLYFIIHIAYMQIQSDIVCVKCVVVFI